MKRALLVAACLTALPVPAPAGEHPYLYAYEWESGRSLPGVRLVLTGPKSLTVTTNHQGEYSTAGLPAGTYQVRASHPRYELRPATGTIRIGPGEKGLAFAAQVKRTK